MSLVQLIGTTHDRYMQGLRFEPRHPTYSSYKGEFSATRLLDKNKTHIFKLQYISCKKIMMHTFLICFKIP